MARRRHRIPFISLILGALLALAAPAGAIDYPLTIDATSQRVVDGQGVPLFFHGDTPWHIIPRLSREQAETYLDERQQRGFNSILISLIVSDDYPGGDRNNFYGESPFLVRDDFSQPNPAYFDHAEFVIAAAHARGMVVFLCPAYIGFECRIEGWCEVMKANGVNVLDGYGRFLAARFLAHPNVIWVNGGDTDAATYGALDEVNAIANGILAVESTHLHTGHSRRFSSAVDSYDEPWLDINNTYSDCSETPRDIRTDFGRVPAKPFFYIEGRYEAHPRATDVCLRGQAYWSLLGGAQGHFFGSENSWDLTDGWLQSLTSNGNDSMEFFGRLVWSRAWEDLVPDLDASVLVDGAGSLDSAQFAAAARTRDGNTIIVYTPESRPLTIAMDAIDGVEAVAWWFNPSTGEATRVGRFPTTGIHVFTPPSAGDWVLVVDDFLADLGEPGRSGSGVPILEQSFGAVKDLFGQPR